MKIFDKNGQCLGNVNEKDIYQDERVDSTVLKEMKECDVFIMGWEGGIQTPSGSKVGLRKVLDREHLYSSKEGYPIRLEPVDFNSHGYGDYITYKIVKEEW